MSDRLGDFPSTGKDPAFRAPNPRHLDDLEQIEGNYDKFLGKAQERYGEKKDELMKWADRWQRRSQPEATKEKTCRGKVIKKS
jgi:hypothetical protein